MTQPKELASPPRSPDGVSKLSAGGALPIRVEVVEERPLQPGRAGRLGLLWIGLRRRLLRALHPGPRRSFWRSLDRIEELSAGRQLPELVQAVQAECLDLAPAGRLGMIELRLSWPLLKLLHPAARRNPCLYLTMLALAFESAAGRPVEVNVALSDGSKPDSAEGHCWLTRQGRPLHGLGGPACDCEAAHLGRSGSVVYWWRKARLAPNPAQGKGLPPAPGSKPWPT